MVILNNPCLGSSLLVICKSNRGRYNFFYIQNHTSLTPLVNCNILSKPMITNVAAYAADMDLAYHTFSLTVVYKRHNVNGIKTYLVTEV